MTQIHTEITGLEFNAHHNHNQKDADAKAKTKTKAKFYKFLRSDLTHYGFKYKLGLNIDIVPFNPSGICSGGGLYFCEESECHLYWGDYGNKMAIVEIPHDARVYVEEHKFKADKIIITKIINFEDVEDSFWINNILPYDGDVLAFIKKHTEEIYNLALQYDGFLLKYMKDEFITDKLCELAVQQNGSAIKYVKDEFITDKLCKLAIQQDGSAITILKGEFITDELCKLAVQQNGFLLLHLKDEFITGELCELAIQQNWRVAQHPAFKMNRTINMAMAMAAMAMAIRQEERYVLPQISQTW